MIVAAATDWTEVAAIAQAAGVVVAICALIAVGIQLAQSRRHARATRAYQYLERYGDPSEIKLNAKLNKFIKAEPAEQAGRRARWEHMPVEERFEILHALNFWEELAGMYRRRLVDRRIVRDYFGSAAIAYWQWAQWFIVYQREKQGSDRPMKDLEDMRSQIVRGQRAEARRMTFPHARQRWQRSDHRHQTARAGDGLHDWLVRLAFANRDEQEAMLAELRAGFPT